MVGVALAAFGGSTGATLPGCITIVELIAVAVTPMVGLVILSARVRK